MLRTETDKQDNRLKQMGNVTCCNYYWVFVKQFTFNYYKSLIFTRVILSFANTSTVVNTIYLTNVKYIAYYEYTLL